MQRPEADKRTGEARSPSVILRRPPPWHESVRHGAQRDTLRSFHRHRPSQGGPGLWTRVYAPVVQLLMDVCCRMGCFAFQRRRSRWKSEALWRWSLTPSMRFATASPCCCRTITRSATPSRWPARVQAQVLVLVLVEARVLVRVRAPVGVSLRVKGIVANRVQVLANVSVEVDPTTSAGPGNAGGAHRPQLVVAVTRSASASWHDACSCAAHRGCVSACAVRWWRGMLAWCSHIHVGATRAHKQNKAGTRLSCQCPHQPPPQRPQPVGASADEE